MTLAETLQAKLASWQPAGDGRHSLSASHDGWAVQVASDANDRLACLTWELSLTRTGDAPAGTTLAAWANGVAARATGLMEPLKVLELDGDEAVLRSTSPTRKGPLAAYYEVRLCGLEEAEVRRYNADVQAGTRREQVAFPLTHEVLAKLAADIAG